MAIVDDDVMEVSVYSLLPGSPYNSPSAMAVLPADLAWADSCLNEDMDGFSMDWSSMKDVLMEIVSSQTGSLNSSSTESGRQSTYCEFLLSGENVTNPFDIRSEKDGNLIVDDMGDAEYIQVSEDDEEGIVLGTQKGTVRGRSRLGSVFQPNCTEDIGKMEHLGSGLDLSLTTYEVEHSSEEIFKVWDLGTSDELHVFSELNEAFGDVPQIQYDGSTLWKDSTNVSIDDLIASVGHLSLTQHTKSHSYLS